MYEIQFTKTAEKQLDKLSQSIQIRIISTLERIKIKPHSHVKKLIGSPYYRVRIGDYRAIIDIKQELLIISVIEVGHRKNIYD